MLAIVRGIEGMIAGGDGFVVDDVLVRWADDLYEINHTVSALVALCKSN